MTLFSSNPELQSFEKFDSGCSGYVPVILQMKSCRVTLYAPDPKSLQGFQSSNSSLPSPSTPLSPLSLLSPSPSSSLPSPLPSLPPSSLSPSPSSLSPPSLLPVFAGNVSDVPRMGVPSASSSTLSRLPGREDMQNPRRSETQCLISGQN